MFKLLLGLVGIELDRAVRHAAITAILFLLGAVLFGGALLAGMAALFIYLAETYDPLAAALIIAAGSFFLAAMLLIAAYGRTRSRRRHATPLSSLGAMMPPPRASVSANPVLGAPRRPLLKGSTVLGVAATAAIIGLILGRRI